MKHWKRESVLLGKGARSPRDSFNFQQKEEKTAERKLKVLNGGNEAEVTHPEPRRRGSRLKKGENRTSRKYSRRTNGTSREVVDLDDYRRNHQPDTATTGVSPTGELAENPTKPDDVCVAPAPSPPIEVEKPRIVTMDDFSPEAIAADKARHEALALSFAEGRAARKGLEEAVENKRQKEFALRRKLLGGGRPSPAAQPPPQRPPQSPDTANEGKCVHHMEFGATTPGPLAAPAQRCSLGSSHIGLPKKRKAKAKTDAAPSEDQSESNSEKPKSRRRSHTK